MYIFQMFSLFFKFQVLTVKFDGQSTPFLAVLQPLSVNLGLIVFFPMGLSLNLEKHLFHKSKQNVSKETDSNNTFQLEKDYLDNITHRFAKKLWNSKYVVDSSDLQRSCKYLVQVLSIFILSCILNYWAEKMFYHLLYTNSFKNDINHMAISIDIHYLQHILGCPHGVMVKAMDCRIVVSEFVLQSRYYVHFRANTLRKGMNPLILPAMG